MQFGNVRNSELRGSLRFFVVNSCKYPSSKDKNKAVSRYKRIYFSSFRSILERNFLASLASFIESPWQYFNRKLTTNIRTTSKQLSVNVLETPRFSKNKNSERSMLDHIKYLCINQKSTSTNHDKQNFDEKIGTSVLSWRFLNQKGS